ncbi:hypothetical protein RvY_09391 [Ramazzottius varieornatus]|uniref:1-acyl-sn-glycerol-3-phosphate acyltransferase n=1 Tax=Ramazzottius varieornatus TaxID=947166 RepID=A0A1D1VBM5_RAMVA|nr:hypothetical protein RvY_09391 [Ramazzottius varieornatus]
MDSSGASSGLFSFLQYFCMLAAIVIPAVWKLYTVSPFFQFLVKQFIYMCCVMLTCTVSVPMAIRNPYDPNNTRDIVAWLFIKFLKVPQIFGITIEHRGLENFDVKGPFIVVCNHQTSLDLIPMCATIPARCTAMGKRELMFAGPFGLSVLLCGGVLVDRRPGKSREAIDQVVRQIKQKNAGLWVFPEGTRNHKGGLLPFKKGAFHMAIQAQIPVIPVVVSSYSPFYEKASYKFNPGKLIVTVLPPVSSKPYTVENIQDFVDNVSSSMLSVFESTSKETASV